MADVTADDVKLAVIPAAKKSESVYRSVNMLYKSIFDSAEESHLIDDIVAQRTYIDLPSEEEYSEYLVSVLDAIYQDIAGNQ